MAQALSLREAVPSSRTYLALLIYAIADGYSGRVRDALEQNLNLITQASSQ